MDVKNPQHERLFVVDHYPVWTIIMAYFTPRTPGCDQLRIRWDKSKRLVYEIIWKAIVNCSQQIFLLRGTCSYFCRCI